MVPPREYEMTVPVMPGPTEQISMASAIDVEQFNRRHLQLNVSLNRSRRWHQLFLLALGILLSMLLFGWLVSVVVQEWQQHISYRIWVIFGLMSYVSVLVYKGFGILCRLAENTLMMQVSIRSTRVGTLYRAVCEYVASVAGCAINGSKSRDMEAGLEYDASFGKSIVKLDFWGRHGKTVKITIVDVSGRKNRST